jgi:hypothetical protein
MPTQVSLENDGDTSRGERVAAWSLGAAGAILVFCFALNCYRAAKQSFVHDESLYFQMYIDAPLSTVFQPYPMRNGSDIQYYADPHFLFTLLMRLSSAVFGNSELSLRLASVLAGGLFFVSVYRLCRLAFRGAWLFLLAVLITAGNPLVLDFMVAARGYGTALGLFTYALLQVALYFCDDDLHNDDWQPPATLRRGRLVKAGLAIGLSFAASNTLAPACMVLTATVAVLLWQRTRGTGGRVGAWARIAVWFFGALAIVAYLFLLTSPSVQVLHNFGETMDANRMPEDTVFASLRNLVQCSLQHNKGLGGINSGVAAFSEGLGLVGWVLGFVLIPLAVLAAAWLGWQKLRQRPGESLALCSALASTIIIGAAAQVVYLHLAFGVPMLHDRYGLYFLPFAGFALAGAADLLRRHGGPPRVAGNAFFAAAALLAIFYCGQLNWTNFIVWKYDADTRVLLEQVAARAEAVQAKSASRFAGRGPRPVVVGGSWVYEPASNYYRIVRGWTWMVPVDRGASDGDYDFYLLTPEDGDVISRLGLERIATGKVSGTLLAARRR